MKQTLFRVLSLCLLAGSFLAACTTSNSVAERSVDVIPASLSQHCVPKGDVYSEAPYFGVFTESTKDKLIGLAKESTLRLGGNALVIGQPTEKDDKYTLDGKAYSCVK